MITGFDSVSGIDNIQIKTIFVTTHVVRLKGWL